MDGRVIVSHIKVQISAHHCNIASADTY